MSWAAPVRGIAESRPGNPGRGSHHFEWEKD